MEEGQTARRVDAHALKPHGAAEVLRVDLVPHPLQDVGHPELLRNRDHRGEQVVIQKQLHSLRVLRLIPEDPALGDQMPQAVGQMGVLLGLQRCEQLIGAHRSQRGEKLVAPSLRISPANLEKPLEKNLDVVVIVGHPKQGQQGGVRDELPQLPAGGEHRVVDDLVEPRLVGLPEPLGIGGLRQGLQGVVKRRAVHEPREEGGVQKTILHSPQSGYGIHVTHGRHPPRGTAS